MFGELLLFLLLVNFINSINSLDLKKGFWRSRTEDLVTLTQQQSDVNVTKTAYITYFSHCQQIP